MKSRRDIKLNQLNRKRLRERDKKKSRIKLAAFTMICTIGLSATFIWGVVDKNARADTAKLIADLDDKTVLDDATKYIDSDNEKEEPYSSNLTYKYKVVKEDSPVYLSVNKTPKTIFNINKGEYVEFQGVENDWAKIKHKNMIGYVENYKLENTKENELKVKDGVLLATKEYSIPKDFESRFDMDAENSLLVMFEAMKRDGLTLGVSRRYIDSEAEVESKQIEEESFDYPDIDHHELRTGRALEFTLPGVEKDKFFETAESKWLIENSYKYGFVQRYPRGKEDITGYAHNDFIYTYVGTENATKMHDSNMVIEEFFK